MATSHKYTQTSNKLTFGAELELVDWPRREPLPHGMAIDDGNYTSVNSNGVAVDGKGKTYHLGGEILTAPSENPSGPADQLVMIKQRWRDATHNYRTGLNVHVRVPGLRDNLKKLKQLQAFVHRVMPELLSIIDPIPIPTVYDYPDERAFKGADKNYATRRRDHHTLLTKERLALQMKARTPKEFFEAEAVHKETGGVHWALHARTCVNLRQMLQTDTIEFRHFFMPDSAEELLNATLWCKLFLKVAFDGHGSYTTPQELLTYFDFDRRAWPKALPYDPWLDKGFYYTSPHYHSAETVATHIEEWLTRECPDGHRKKAGDVHNNEFEK